MNSINLPKVQGFKMSMWTKVAGKERVYMTLLAKSNGGLTWNGGVGREDYLDIATMTWHEKTEWAGSQTRADYESAVDAAKAEVVAAVKASLAAAEPGDDFLTAGE